MREINIFTSCLHPLIWHVDDHPPNGFAAEIEARSNDEIILTLLIHPQGTSRRQGLLDRRHFAKVGLAALLKEDADAITITADAFGCPQIFVIGKPCLWSISFAARDCYSLIGLARFPLGVDLECPIRSSAIPWNILHPQEREALEAMPERARIAAFLSLWCRKEAILKALGTGFHIPPENLTIPLFTADWHILDLTPPVLAMRHRLHVKAQALHLTERAKPAFSLLETGHPQASSFHTIDFDKAAQPEPIIDFDVMVSACLLTE